MAGEHEFPVGHGFFLDNPSCFLVGAKVKSDAIMKILRK